MDLKKISLNIEYKTILYITKYISFSEIISAFHFYNIIDN